MGRKRLLTLLAALTAAIGLQVAPATALEVDTDDGCVGITADAGLLELDPKVCASSDDGVSVDGGAKGTDTDVDVGEATQPVEDAVNGVVKQPAEPEVEPEDPPGDQPKSDDGASSNTGSDDPPKAPRVATSGEAREAEARQLEARRAVRSDLAAGAMTTGDPLGPVSPGVPGADSSALAQPGGSIPEPEVSASRPQVTAPRNQDTVLATSAPPSPITEAPLALKLLATALVLGAGAVWLVAQREYGTVVATGH